MKKTKEVSREVFNRKCTKKDIEALKKRGIDHWAFDEMEWNEDGTAKLPPKTGEGN
jgi:hypothetical protein